MKAKTRSSHPVQGLAISGLMLATFAVLYAAALQHTMSLGDGYFWRPWNWSEYLIGAVSLGILAFRWRQVTGRVVMLSVVFAALVGVSAYSRTNFDTAAIQAVITMLALGAGFALLPKDRRVQIAALDQSPRAVVQPVVLGVVLGLPASVANVAYFALTGASLDWQNPLTSALWSLQPSVYEEIAFRFLIINLCVFLLEGRLSRSAVRNVALFMAVVPHAILHYTEMLVYDTGMAVLMIAIISLIFGLPAAYLQWRRNLESAMGYHWITDFLRFLAGF